MCRPLIRGLVAGLLLLDARGMAADRAEQVERPTLDAAAYANRPGSQPFQLIRASQALGQEVRTTGGEHLGLIQDLAVDVSRRRIAYAVIDCGRFLQLDSRLFAVPWKALARDGHGQSTPDNQKLTLEMDRERLRRAAGFDAAQWPDMADERWARDLHACYGLRPYWERESATSLQGEPVSAVPTRFITRGRPQQATRAVVLKANVEMFGHAVTHASNGERLGAVEEILTDHRTGDVALIVLQLDRNTSVTRTDRRRNHVALPVQMFSFVPNGDPNAPYVIECCLENLKSHRFREDRWPDLRSKSWAEGLYRDFGRTPYWEQR